MIRNCTVRNKTFWFLALTLVLTLFGNSGVKGLTLKETLREKYDELPEKGKFGVGAAGGFIVSRLAVKSATTVVKLAGAAYVA